MVSVEGECFAQTFKAEFAFDVNISLARYVLFENKCTKWIYRENLCTSYSKFLHLR